MKKGQRAETTYKGEVLTGVIASGGAKKNVMILDGGDNMISGPPQSFRPSDAPLPTDKPNNMDKWGIKNYKEVHGHDDSVPFTCKITLNGKAVMFAENDGWGGCNSYSPLTSFSKTFRNTEKQFREDAQRWAREIGGVERKILEVEDLWISWMAYGKPYGQLGADYLKEFAQDPAEKWGTK